MSELKFVNVHGQLVSTAPAQKTRAKREAPESYHKGFVVLAVSKGAEA